MDGPVVPLRWSFTGVRAMGAHSMAVPWALADRHGTNDFHGKKPHQFYGLPWCHGVRVLSWCHHGLQLIAVAWYVGFRSTRVSPWQNRKSAEVVRCKGIEKSGSQWNYVEASGTAWKQEEESVEGGGSSWERMERGGRLKQFAEASGGKYRPPEASVEEAEQGYMLLQSV